MGWKVGNGRSINIWSEALLPGTKRGIIFGQDINVNYTVAIDLIDLETITSRREVLEELFDADHIDKILSLPSLDIGGEDSRIWRGDNTREYSTKSVQIAFDRFDYWRDSFELSVNYT